MEITPTFYTRNGQVIVGTPFTMQAAEVKTVDLKTLMPTNIRNRKDLSGMSLDYVGRPLEMWGQLRLLRTRTGSSVDITFTYMSDRRSVVRNAVWSSRDNSTAIIAVGNPRPTTTKAVLQFANGDIEELQVPAFGTEIIRRSITEHGSGTTEADAVTIRSVDGSVDFVVAGAVLSPKRGFTSSIRFYDTEVVAQQNLFATNARLHNVDSRLVLRNVGNSDLVATPRLRPVSGDANNFVDLAPVILKSNEIQVVDLNPLATNTQHLPEFRTVSIEVMNTGPKGSLIGALNGTDLITGMNYDVPLRDSGGTRSSTGAYPWRLDGDFSTIVSITNVSALPTQFIVQINYAGGRYILNPQTLPAGATATFDLRKIHDEQIPDRDGHTIPRSIVGGQFRWSVFGPGTGRLIGRAEMLSASRGISSSYSCGTSCPPTYGYGWMNPDPAQLPDGESVSVDTLQMNVDSYNNEYGPYSSNVVSSWSGDSNVATFNFGVVNAIGYGSTSLTSTVEYPLYYWESSSMDCIEFGTNQTNVNGQTTVQGTVSLGSVSFTSPNPAVIRKDESATLTVVITATSVPANTPIGLQVSATNVSGSVSLTISPSNSSQAVGGGNNQSSSTTVSITFVANDNPASSVTLNGHAKLVKVEGTPDAVVIAPMTGTEKDSSNTLTVQHQ